MHEWNATESMFGDDCHIISEKRGCWWNLRKSAQDTVIDQTPNKPRVNLLPQIRKKDIIPHTDLEKWNLSLVYVI